MKRLLTYFSTLILTGVGYLSAQSLSIPQGVLVESGLNAEFIAKFALFIAILLIWTVGWGKILKRIFCLPIIAGQIIAGILLGPSLINLAAVTFFAEPLQMVDYATGKLYALASSDLFLFFVLLLSSSFTVGYLLWLAGHETNIKEMFKVGLPATSAGILGAILPILMTIFAARWFFGPEYDLLSSTGLGLILAATSVSIPVAMLFVQNKMHMKSSQATLGAAIIDDIFAIILLSFFFIALDMGVFGSVIGVNIGHRKEFVNAVLYLLLSFGVIGIVGYFGIRPLIKWLHAKRLTHLVTPIANSIMFLYFAFAELLGGLAGITGAFFAGLFHRMGDTRHHAEKVISPFVNAILLPLFLCSIGLQVDLKLLDPTQWGIVLLLLIIAISSKLIACFCATGLSNFLNRKKERWSLLEGYIFGSSMVARGEVGLVVATILNGTKVITPNQYVIAVVVIVLTTIATPIMLSIGFSLQETKKKGIAAPVSVNLGVFDVIGTTHLFNIILGRLEASKTYKTTVQISEGRKIANIQELNVKIILCPGEGIIFEGKKRQINTILDLVRDEVNKELERCMVT